MSIQLHPSIAVHPGPWLKRNVIDHFALSVTDAADHLGVSRQSMSKLLDGRQGLSAEMAIRFEKAFGLKADTLMRMQSAHELAEARAHEDEIEVERVAA
jgi:addiction module HigA family antidote